MKLYPENLYHIYNRGNNRQKIFFTRKNYLYFLNKVKDELKPFSDIVCYCLMPNHFHFMVSTFSNFDQEQFSNGFRILLSSYTNAINIQEKRVGSLFQQNSKAKCLTDKNRQGNYGLLCFNYIHQNPVISKLVDKMEDWEFSSFKDYMGFRSGTLCNKVLAYELVGMPGSKEEFYKISYDLLDTKKLSNIF